MALASPRGLDIGWPVGRGKGGYDVGCFEGYGEWLVGLKAGAAPVYDWRGHEGDRVQEAREVEAFMSAKGPAVRDLLGRNRRLDDEGRAIALEKLGHTRVTALGLEFPELPFGHVSSLRWRLKDGCDADRTQPVAKDFMHSFRAQNLLLDAWDVYPPVILDWLGATISMGVNLNFVGDRSRSVRHENHPSIRDNMSQVVEELEKEMAEGRRPNWFAEPPFEWFIQSPVGQVPKVKVSLAESGKFVLEESLRVIMDWSFGLEKRVSGDKAAPDSINAQIPLMDISCISFDQMLVTFLEAGKGAFATVFDFAHAHQSISVRVEDWPVGLVYIPGKGYAISTRCQYGSRRSGGVWEVFAELFTVLLYVKWGIAGVLRWVDDLCHFAKDKEAALHVQALVVYLSQRYGFKLHPAKIRGPLEVGEFMGLLWCPAECTISLPPTKRFKYTEALGSLLLAAQWRVSDIHSAMGIIVYLSRLLVSIRFMAVDWAALLKGMAPNTKAPLHLASCRPPKQLCWHIKTVLAVLKLHSGSSTPFIHSKMKAFVGPRVPPLEIFVDASGSCGWGCFVPLTKKWACGLWSSEQIESHWVSEGKSSPLFEAQGLCMALWSLGLRDQEILVRSDASVVVEKYKRPSSRFGKVEKLNEAMLALCVSECMLNVSIVLSHIPGVSNVYADLLSRGKQGLADFLSRATSEGWSPLDSRVQATSPPLELCRLTPQIFW